MRKLLFLGLTVIYALISTFCEYTPDVLAHVTNEDKYISVEMEVLSVKYNDEGYSYIYARLYDFEHYEGFMGVAPEEQTNEVLVSSAIRIKILPENAIILKQNGFFDEAKLGDRIALRTTCWAHNGLNHNYVAQISIDDIEYLDDRGHDTDKTSGKIGQPAHRTVDHRNVSRELSHFTESHFAADYLRTDIVQ